MGNNTSRILVETLVRRTIKEIRRSPERSIRNLVDLAVHFSKGRFQRMFFETAQTMLENERSPYYELARDVTEHVDTERLVRFSMNLGYNGCVVGARKIREREEKEGFNIPWAVSLVMDGRQFADRQEKYHAVVGQGEELGIYTWLLFSEGKPQELLPLVAGHPDSAFALFCDSQDVTLHFLDDASELNNLMIVVRCDEGTSEACRLLRESEMLYSVCFVYKQNDAEDITSGELFYSLQQIHPAFAALLPDPACPREIREEVSRYVEYARKQQLFQTIAWDLVADSRLVDGVISSDACSACFDLDGSLHIEYEHKTQIDLNLLENNLADILKRAFPKKPECNAAPCPGSAV